MYPYIDFFGRQIPTYGLCMVLAIFLVGFLTVLYAKKVNVVFEDILIIGAAAVLSGLLGGWLLYLCVTYSPNEILDMVRCGDFRFLQGGLVFYGALIGGILGGLFGTRLVGIPVKTIERCVVPYIPFGHAIGRIGCVFGGCCNGAPYDGFCALYYTNSLLGLDPHQGYFPVQLLEAVILMVIGLLLLCCRNKATVKLELLAFYLGLYGFARFLLEFLRGDAIRGFAGGISTSQWISLLLLCSCLIYYIFLRPKLQQGEEKMELFRNETTPK